MYDGYINTIMKKNQIYYAIGGLMTVLTGYFIYDLVRGNQITKKQKIAKEENTDQESLGSQETGSNSKKDSNDSYPIKVGSYGAKVVVLQLALNALGSSLQVDGKFGQNTYNAVRNISSGFGGLNMLCGIDYSCKLTYNNWSNIIEKANEKGFDVNKAWTIAKTKWKL